MASVPCYECGVAVRHAMRGRILFNPDQRRRVYVLIHTTWRLPCNSPGVVSVSSDYVSRVDPVTLLGELA